MEFRTITDVVYIDVAGTELKMDLFRPMDDNIYPLILHIHGGGWAEGQRAGTAEFFSSYIAQGYLLADIDYRLAPAHPYPAACDDVRAAAQWLLAHASAYGGDATRFGALGFSAGGHLSALLATEADTPLSCAVCWGSPTDMLNEPVTFPYRGYAWAFMSTCPAENPAPYIEASPLKRLTAKTPPILHIHGSEDTVVPVHHAQLLSEAASKSGAPIEILIQEGGGHCVAGNNEDAQYADNLIKEFFARHLKPYQNS